MSRCASKLSRRRNTTIKSMRDPTQAHTPLSRACDCHRLYPLLSRHPASLRLEQVVTPCIIAPLPTGACCTTNLMSAPCGPSCCCRPPRPCPPPVRSPAPPCRPDAPAAIMGRRGWSRHKREHMSTGEPTATRTAGGERDRLLLPALLALLPYSQRIVEGESFSLQQPACPPPMLPLQPYCPSHLERLQRVEGETPLGLVAARHRVPLQVLLYSY